MISALRLKALYLAISPDFIFAQSYLGLLSAIGAMLGVMLCTTLFLVEIVRRLKRWVEAGSWVAVSELFSSRMFGSRTSRGWSQV